jgi:hypothetical protein
MKIGYELNLDFDFRVAGRIDAWKMLVMSIL